MRKFIVLACLGLLGLVAALAVSPTAGAGCTTVFGVQVCGEDIPDGPAVTLCTDEESCNAGEGPPEDPPESTDEEEEGEDPPVETSATETTPQPTPVDTGTTTTTSSPIPAPPPVATETKPTTTVVQPAAPPVEIVTTTTTARPAPPQVVEKPDICTNHPGMKSLPNSRWTRLGDGSCKFENPNADVAVNEQVDRAVATVGDVVTFTIVVRNNGEGEAPDVGLSKPIPRGLELKTPNDVAVAPSDKGRCDPEGGVGSQVVRCHFPMIDLHESVTVTIRVEATGAGTTSSQAEVGTDKRADQNMGNNRDAKVIEVSAQASKPAVSAAQAPKPKSMVRSRTAYITVRAPDHVGDHPLSFRLDIMKTLKDGTKKSEPRRIWNNQTTTFSLPPGATSEVEFNGAKCAGWKLHGTTPAPLHWVYEATRMPIPPECQKTPTTKPQSSTRPDKPATLFIWVSIYQKAPDGTKNCQKGKYVRLNLHPRGGGEAFVGRRATCSTPVKLKLRQLGGSLCEVLQDGTRAETKGRECLPITRSGQLLHFVNVG